MDRPSIISVPIKDQDQGWDKWNHFALYCELKNQRIGLSFQEHDIIWYRDKIPMGNKMQFDFGATNFVVEPPRMALKNIAMSLTKRELWDFEENWQRSLKELIHQQ